MSWLFAFVFWFSLIYATYAGGNAIGNWIALVALFLWMRSRRAAMRSTPATAATQQQASAQSTQTGATSSRQASVRRWR